VYLAVASSVGVIAPHHGQSHARPSIAVGAGIGSTLGKYRAPVGTCRPRAQHRTTGNLDSATTGSSGLSDRESNLWVHR